MIVNFDQNNSFVVELLQTEVTASFEAELEMIASFEEEGSMSCSLGQDDAFSVEFGTGASGGDYAGPYQVTPTISTQTLLTEGKTLSGNITVNPIPSNYGLITWNGSTLTVS